MFGSGGRVAKPSECKSRAASCSIEILTNASASFYPLVDPDPSYTAGKVETVFAAREFRALVFEIFRKSKFYFPYCGSTRELNHMLYCYIRLYSSPSFPGNSFREQWIHKSGRKNLATLFSKKYIYYFVKHKLSPRIYVYMTTVTKNRTRSMSLHAVRNSSSACIYTAPNSTYITRLCRESRNFSSVVLQAAANIRRARGEKKDGRRLPVARPLLVPKSHIENRFPRGRRRRRQRRRIVSRGFFSLFSFWHEELLCSPSSTGRASRAARIKTAHTRFCARAREKRREREYRCAYREEERESTRLREFLSTSRPRLRLRMSVRR